MESSHNEVTQTTSKDIIILLRQSTGCSNELLPVTRMPIGLGIKCVEKQSSALTLPRENWLVGVAKGHKIAMECTDNEISTEIGGEAITTAFNLRNKISLYMKLIRTHETTAIWLTLWPGIWSMTLAAKDTSIPLPQLSYCLFLMVIYSVILLSISNIYNDFIDKDFDKKVERCKDRPLASGAVSTVEAAALLSPFLLLYAVLMLQVNEDGKLIMLVSLGLVGVYPFAKRATDYPAVVLGLAANISTLLGWNMVRGDVDWSICAPLLAGAFFWTIVYDTIYGMQDAEDDARVGVKSMALSFGSRVRTLAAAASLLATLCFAATGVAVGLSRSYYVALTAVLVHLFTQVFNVDKDDPKDCDAKYQSNRKLALILFLGFVAGI